MKQLSRRQFIRNLSALGLTVPAAANGFLSFDWLNNNIDDSEFWLSAQGKSKDQYGFGVVKTTEPDSNSSRATSLPTGFRGHGLSQNPARPEQTVMIARRPGIQGVVLNTQSWNIEHRFQCHSSNHMHGHACYSHDGKYLYCSESNIDTGEGRITVRETNQFKLINEFSSHGIGPHEIALMPDRKTLVVANGGLLTHPDSGRKVLNLETMDSSLAYIDLTSGRLKQKLKVKEEKASIRHLDVAPDGTVALAIQVQRKAIQHNELVPLAAVHVPDTDHIKELPTPEPLLIQLNDYMGSVRIHSDANTGKLTAGFTSPRGDLAMFWDLTTLEFKSHHSFHDVCGLTISKDNKRFVLSNSAGKIRQISTVNLKEQKQYRQHFPNMNWDNHMITV